MKELLITVSLLFSINSFAFSIECKDEASLYIDNQIATDICQNVNLGFEDCAQITKEEINQAPIMSETDLIRCTKAFYGFKDCYPIAINGLDKKFSLNLCLNAKKDFKECAQAEMENTGIPAMTETQIKNCLASPL